VDTIATILNPVNGYRDQLVRKASRRLRRVLCSFGAGFSRPLELSIQGLEPKNHIAENRHRPLAACAPHPLDNERAHAMRPTAPPAVGS